MLLLHKTVKTHEQRIMEALKKAGHFGMWTRDLAKPNCGGHRFSAYIRDLRKDGHNISRVRISNYESKYFLDD